MNVWSNQSILIHWWINSEPGTLLCICYSCSIRQFNIYLWLTWNKHIKIIKQRSVCNRVCHVCVCWLGRVWHLINVTHSNAHYIKCFIRVHQIGITRTTENTQSRVYYVHSCYPSSYVYFCVYLLRVSFLCVLVYDFIQK